MNLSGKVAIVTGASRGIGKEIARKVAQKLELRFFDKEEVKKFAIFILMIADVMAAIIGKIIPVKKVEILGAYKSIGGSTAFAVGILIAIGLSFGGFSDLGSLPVLRVALTILVLEFFEFLNWRSIDNLSLPLAALLAGSILFT